MRTKKQVISDLKDFIKRDEKYIEGLISRTVDNIPERIFEEAEDNYALSKTILCAVYKEMSRQYAPVNPMSRKDKKTFDLIYSRTR